MGTIKVTVRLLTGETDPLLRYEIAGWVDSAAEIYSIGKDTWLGLCNSHSTGFRRKVFKSSKSLNLWIMRTLQKEFPCDRLEFCNPVY